MEAKEVLKEILFETLRKCDPYRAIKEGCYMRGDVLKAFGEEIAIEGRIYLIGVGKASCRMIRAMKEILGKRIYRALAITKRGYEEKIEGVKVISAGHPLPDEKSVEGGKLAMNIAEEADLGDLVIFLVSGGGSSLMCMPPPGISLEDLRRLYLVLLSSGMKIQEVNTVRRHVSMIKGGKLMQKILPAKCLTIAISDVVGDTPQDIASGPTFPDPTTFQDALSLIEDYGIKDKVPESVLRHLEKGAIGEVEENPKKFPEGSLHYFIIGSKFLCQTAAEVSKSMGITPYIFSTSVEGDAQSLGTFLAELALAIKEGRIPALKPCCLIGSGEVTVHLSENWGKGGPNQEVALSAATRIRGKKGIFILSMDTDGTDGPTDAAGGIVDGNSYDKMRKEGISPEKALREHTAYEALRRADSLLITGPTGNNLNDLYLALICRKLLT